MFEGLFGEEKKPLPVPPPPPAAAQSLKASGEIINENCNFITKNGNCHLTQEIVPCAGKNCILFKISKR